MLGGKSGLSEPKAADNVLSAGQGQINSSTNVLTHSITDLSLLAEPAPNKSKPPLAISTARREDSAIPVIDSSENDSSMKFIDAKLHDQNLGPKISANQFAREKSRVIQTASSMDAQNSTLSRQKSTVSRQQSTVPRSNSATIGKRNISTASSRNFERGLTSQLSMSNPNLKDIDLTPLNNGIFYMIFINF